ncbi:MAG TPA: transcriptional regulator [Ktedonobacterales bacterium]
MRADRLLTILLLLQANRRVTAQKLAKRLEVSERTIYRDIEALSAAGVPVYAERGPGGGCALLGEYRSGLTGLNESDVRTLLLSGVPGPLADLGLDKALEAALLKLLAALPSARRPEVEQARQRLHLDAAAWNAPDVEEIPYLRTIQEAVWQDRKLRLSYRRKNWEVVERVVEPLGLVAKASIWYLVGRVDSQQRVYRISRVQAATLTEETFERPENFDLAAYWAEWLAGFRGALATYPVTARFAPEAIPIIPHVFGEAAHALIEQAGPPDREGRITLQLTFESGAVACSMLLGFGPLVEVLEPPELRRRIIQQAENIVAFYRQAPQYEGTSPTTG